MGSLDLSSYTVILGGRFDPPHLGHRCLVEELIHRWHVRQVWVVPSACPPHKPAVASFAHRFQMIQLTFKDVPRVICSSLEEKRRQEHPSEPSYSWNTLLEVRSQVSGPLAFALGSDQIPGFSQWYGFPELLSLVDWFVFERRGVSLLEQHRIADQWKCWELQGLLQPENNTEGCSWKTLGGQVVRVLPTQAAAWSATAIREHHRVQGLLSQGSLDCGLREAQAEGLSQEVWEYLKNQSLYSIRGPR